MPLDANCKWAVEDPGNRLHIVECTASGNWFGANNLTHQEKGPDNQALVRETLKGELLRHPKAGVWGGYVWVALD